MTVTIEKMSEKERAPFLRTLQVWDERRVFSSTYVTRLRAAWDAKPVLPDAPSWIENQCDSRLLHGDSRMANSDEILHRVVKQSNVSQIFTERLLKSIHSIDMDVSDTTGTDSLSNYDVSLGLLTSLVTELIVCLDDIFDIFYHRT